MYDYGTKINNTPSSTDGVLTAEEFNVLALELETVINSMGITLSGSSTNQLTKAIADYALAGQHFIDSGIADAYVLTSVGSRLAPHDYIDGMRLRFFALATNTGASTVNVQTLGVKAIKRPDGSALSAADIVANSYIELMYRTSGGYFILTSNVTISGDQTIFDLKTFDEAPRSNADPSNANDLVRKSYLESYVTSLVTVPKGYVNGLVISNNGSDANNDIDIATGTCASSDGTYALTLASGLTKRLDAAWAVGTNQGGLFDGSKTLNTWYHVFLIRKTSDGTIDAGFDTSLTAANMPGTYNAYRRIGSVLTDASNNIRAFIQRGGNGFNEFLWSAPSLDINGAYAASRSLLTLPVPLGVRCKASILYTHDGEPAVNATWSYWTDPSMTDTAPNTTQALAHDTSPLTIGSARHVDVWSNTSSQVGYRPNYAVTLRARCYSYLDFL